MFGTVSYKSRTVTISPSRIACFTSTFRSVRLRYARMFLILSYINCLPSFITIVTEEPPGILLRSVRYLSSTFNAIFLCFLSSYWIGLQSCEPLCLREGSKKCEELGVVNAGFGEISLCGSGSQLFGQFL